MKTLLLISFFLISGLALAQSSVSNHKQVDQNGNAIIATGSASLTSVQKTKPIGIAIDPLLQADIKQLDEAMKPYEDIVKEYNRIVGLRTRIYETLIKAKGIAMKDLSAPPQITSDSLKLIIIIK